MAKIGLEAVTIPRELFNTQQLRRVINNTLQELSKDIKADFGVTTQTWKNKPDFKIDKPSDEERIIGTDDDIYHFVSGGTKPHVISAKNAPNLAFNTTFRPKTRVRVIKSTAGFSGPPMAYKKQVQHPGTDAREFDEEIAKKWRQHVPIEFQRAISAELTRE